MISNFLFDMETADPDDVFAMALLATHPRSNLVAVTIHPGGKDQVGLVKHVLNLLGKKIPVGVGTPKGDKPRVSQFHYDWLGRVPDQDPDGTATEVIHDVIIPPRGISFEPREFHLVTGAALTNIADAAHAMTNIPDGGRISQGSFFSKWTCQGGFAGDNIVPPEFRLAKFDGRLTCPTFNLGGDWRAAEYLTRDISPPIEVRNFVPKNVCHGIIHSPEANEMIPSGAHPGLDFIKAGMNHYFKKHPGGKALHDVIAAAAAIEPSIGTWKSVSLYRTKNNEWGCKEYSQYQSDVQFGSEIMIKLDISAFNRVLVA
jgi:pyrimidine-specific ribonucleoside hydrolase